MVLIFVYLCLAIIALCLLMMVGFGLMNAGARLGNESKLGLAAFALPVLILAIVFAISGSWTQAAVWTAIIMAVSGLASLLISGVRGLFS